MKRQKYDVTQNSTVTVDLSDDQDLALLLATASTGGYTVTFAGVDKWISPTGSAPAQPTAVGRAAEWVFFQANGVTYGEKTSESGPAGSAGAAGPAGITWRGTYSAAAAYAANDAVAFAGSSYIALQASSSTDVQQPDLAPTYWGVLASGGGAGGGSADTVDTFERANNANISTNAPFAYTVDSGTFEILSNKAHISTTGSTPHCYVRATGAVPISVDQHAQITIGTWVNSGSTNTQVGVTCRSASSAANRYETEVRYTGPMAINLRSIVGGVDTIIGTYVPSSPPVAGDTLKLTCVGSLITVYYNGIQRIQVTNTAVDGVTVGGRQCGFHGVRFSSAVDVAISEFRFGS